MRKKEKRKKKRGGGAVAGVGVLALAGLLALDPFGLGLGEGIGLPTGGENISQTPEESEGPSTAPSVTPEATTVPVETVDPAPTEGVEEVVLKEVSVEVNGKKLFYNGEEAESAQRLAAQFVTEYAAELSDLLVKIQLTDAVYDTVEELKLALENCGIKYEIAE